MASTRLPEKPLADIVGKSLIEHVYLKAIQVKDAEVIVATDDARIYDHVFAFGGKAAMTSSEHQSGTDRIAEVASGLDSDIIINLQGDEPMINPKQIEELIQLMQMPHVEIGTQCVKLDDPQALFDYNVVKVVRDYDHKALYFSRQAIPAFRDLKYEAWIEKADYFKHVGMYGFKREALMKITTLPPSELEKTESLEQLRWLQHGFNIYCKETTYASIGVDTIEDLNHVREIMVSALSTKKS